jgi:hypothetical protein
MCNCAGGGSFSPTQLYEAYVPTQEQIILNQNCPYSYSQLVTWLGKLQAIKDSETNDIYNITMFKLNSDLGYLKSALNYPKNLCFFESQLAGIYQLINQIDGVE